MEYVQLGKSDMRVSRIAFGCMSLGEEDTANEKILYRALDLGINFFDTADLYAKGMNEVSVGKAFKRYRDKVYIATKVGNQWRADGSGWDWNPRKEYILTEVEKSLQRLQIDYIDLYQLHGGTIDDNIDESIEAFELLKQQGKIRYYGISSIRPNVIREYIKRSNIVSVMMQYSLLDRRPEETCLSLLHENNIGVLARGAVAQGLLVNKPPKPYLNYTPQEVEKAAAAINALSRNQRNTAQTALRYVLHHPAITTAVAGIRTMQQLEEAVATFKTPLLTNQDITTLQHAVVANKYEQHR
ncbi:oxidoreductase [Niastella yeongjuensis]|uniref:Oxidoreductase n=1 Tax=Niastella yeongjuensis TaxID=354355 RepID=A0A1V9ENN5_9BACT|nr:aldo/keto reductase [Niastella yeongjuensis]OQP47758.1 oxidoreductase [Niastella yeongjuensis]SEP45463.1 Predicted oxidoreductase [Niastella yeongjuensis]